MKRMQVLYTSVAALLVVILALVSTLVSFQPVRAATVTICNTTDTVDINGKVYEVQNNVWNDVNGSNCLSVDNVSGAFTVTSANHNKATNGAPAAYPSIFKGCHWGNCTNSSGMPIQVSALSSATSSWSTSQPGSGVYDVAYDIWFNTTPTTSGQPNGAELMIWINHLGSIQPVGSRVASGVSVAGTSWDVWTGNSGWNVISYVKTSGVTSVSNLNLVSFINDAVSRGQIQTSWYLIDVEAGFEIWQQGAGLASNSFSVSASGGGGGATNTPTRTPTRTNTPTTTNTPTRTSTGATPTFTPTPTRTQTPPTGGGTCAVTYAVANDWGTGFTANVTIANNSTAAVNGWTLGWTFPGNQTITNLWNGTYTQSGAAVSVKSLSYNSTIGANGGSVSFGFNANYSGTNAKPASFSLNGTTCQ